MDGINQYCINKILDYCRKCYRHYYPLRLVNQNFALNLENQYREDLKGLLHDKSIPRLLSRGYQLSDNFIIKYWDVLDSYFICKYQKNMSTETIIYIWRNHSEFIKCIICYYQKLPFELISEYVDDIMKNRGDYDVMEWLNIFFIHKKNVLIPNWFLNKYEKYILDFNIIKYQQENEMFILKHHKQITNWSCIFHRIQLPSWFIATKREFLEPRDYFLAKGVGLPFIRKHANLEDWMEIVKYQSITLNDFICFIEPHNRSKEFWNDLSVHSQHVNPQVIHRYADHFNWDFLCKNANLPAWLLQTHIDKINWNILTECQKLTQEFIDKNITHFSISLLLKRQKVSDDTLATIIHLDSKKYITEISEYQKPSLEFVKRYAPVLEIDTLFIRSDISDEIKKYIYPYLDHNVYKLPSMVY